jgi:lysyl-tRNA synthetase class I
MCDESSPDIDYNSPDYTSKPINEYATEVNLFMQGVSYLASNLKEDMTEEEINVICFDAARAAGGNMKLFFSRIYNTLFRQPSGPRLSTFIHLLGVNRFLRLLDSKVLDPLNTSS